MVVGSWETNQVFNRAERVERVYGGESGFNAETRCARREAIGSPERSEPEGPQGAARRKRRREVKAGILAV